MTDSKGRGLHHHRGGTPRLLPGAATGIATAPSHPSSAPPAVITIQSQTFLGIAGLEILMWIVALITGWLRRFVVRVPQSSSHM